LSRNVVDTIVVFGIVQFSSFALGHWFQFVSLKANQAFCAILVFFAVSLAETQVVRLVIHIVSHELNQTTLFLWLVMFHSTEDAGNTDGTPSQPKKDKQTSS
jgi:hypothetical protein